MADVPELTMRDWFAAQALSGMLAQPQQGGPPIGAHVNLKSLEPWVRRSYEFADLMLQEREKKRSTMTATTAPEAKISGEPRQS